MTLLCSCHHDKGGFPAPVGCGEGARGLLDRAGIIRKDGNSWVTCATLEQALSINDDLQAYANARAQLVRLDKTDETSQVTPGAATGVSGERG